MKVGGLLGWLAAAITSIAEVANFLFSGALLLSDMALVLAAVAAAKRFFIPALVTYGVWMSSRFGVHHYHLALFDTTNTAHTFVISEFVFVNVIFLLGCSIGLMLSLKDSSDRNFH